MRIEPEIKRAMAFIDGQNLFYAVKEAFGYTFPNYDPYALAQAVCTANGWQFQGAHFYTGLPDPEREPNWHCFWLAKLEAMRLRGVTTFSRPLRYHEQAVSLPSGECASVMVGHEKGVDVRIALDAVRQARESRYDVALLFTQDQDLSEAVVEVKNISSQQDRWIKLACAFPVGPSSMERRGVNGTDWIRIEREMYDACIDRSDYRPKDPSTCAGQVG